MDGCETKMDGLVLEVRWKVSSKPCGKPFLSEGAQKIHCWEDLILTQGAQGWVESWEPGNDERQETDVNAGS